MIDLSKATVKYAFSLPLDGLPSKTLWQGGDVAIDPVSFKSYLFQMQAKDTGPGDVQDINIHRYLLTEKNGFLSGASYMDTTIGKGYGHCQTLHTRISAASNAWHWLGMETYDANHIKNGNVLVRLQHKRGIVERKEATLVYTGPGDVTPISCIDWDVVLRRVSGNTEIYEWHSERDLLARKVNDIDRPVPITSITVPKGSTIHQTSAASPERGNVVRFNGATSDPSLLTAFSGQWSSTLDVTKAAPPDLTVTSEEPEIAFWHKGVLYFGKRYNSVARRVVSYFSVV